MPKKNRRRQSMASDKEAPKSPTSPDASQPVNLCTREEKTPSDAAAACSRNKPSKHEYEDPLSKYYIAPELRVNRTEKELEAAVALAMLSEKGVFFGPKISYDKLKKP